MVRLPMVKTHEIKDALDFDGGYTRSCLKIGQEHDRTEEALH